MIPERMAVDLGEGVEFRIYFGAKVDKLQEETENP